MNRRLFRAILAVLVGGLLTAEALADTAAGTGTGATIRIGSTREEVLAALGEPQGSLRGRDSEMLVFRAGDVELRSGRVVKVSEALREPADTGPAASAPTDADETGEGSTADGAALDPRIKGNQELARAFLGRFAKGGKSADGSGGAAKFGLVSMLGVAVIVLGGLLSLVASIWFLVKAFGEHVLWGLACLFLPFAALVFVIMHWRVALKPFLLSLAGSAVMVGGMMLMFFGAAAG